MFQVRLLTPEDASVCEQLFKTDWNRYLTAQVNLEVYGYNRGEVSSWGAFDGEALVGILFRYVNMVVLVDADGGTVPSFAPLVDLQEGLAGARGSWEAMQALRHVLQRYCSTSLELSPFMRLDVPPRCSEDLLRLARRATMDDLDELADLYAGAGTMYRSRPNVMNKLKSGRVFVVDDPSTQRIVSCALLNVESSRVGIIGGVYTHPTVRGRGYAAACTAALSIDLQKDGKLPCLFYENPVAGRVYSRLGFREVCAWGLLYLHPKEGA